MQNNLIKRILIAKFTFNNIKNANIEQIFLDLIEAIFFFFVKKILIYTLYSNL